MRLVFEAKKQHPLEWAAIASIAANLGCSAETLRRWVRRHQRDTGQRGGGQQDGANPLGDADPWRRLPGIQGASRLTKLNDYCPPRC